MFWKTQSFHQHHRLWERKLKENGFEDCEIERKGERFLKQYSHNCYRQASPLERETRLNYYCLIGRLANSITNERDKLILTLHSEGLTNQAILKLTGIKHRNTITHIIRRYQHKWQIRTWKPNQMNLKKVIS
jgi:hypothetical protein